MSGLLSNLPSKGLLVGKSSKPGYRSSVRRTPSVPQYCATNDTSAPANQLITTDQTNRLLAKFHSIMKNKQLKREGGAVQGSTDKKAKKY